MVKVSSFAHGHGKAIVEIAGRKMLVMETSNGFAVNTESGKRSEALEICARVAAERALARKRARELKKIADSTGLKNIALF